MNSGRFDGTSGDHAGRATRSLTTSPQIYQHAGSATHHTLQLGSPGSVFRPITYSPSSIVLPTRDITLVKAASNPSTPRTSAAAAAAATSFTTFDGTPPSDTSYPLSMDRFPWAGDAHAATAIRG
ncbi:carbohydrate-binding module family 21 [Ilyonectria robusta]